MVFKNNIVGIFFFFFNAFLSFFASNLSQLWAAEVRCRPEEAQCHRCSAPAWGCGPPPGTPRALSPSAWSCRAEAAGAGGGSWQPSLRPVARETPLLSAASEQLPDTEPGAGRALRRGLADNGTSWGRSVLGLARPTLPGGPAGQGQSHRIVGLERALQRSSGPTPEGRAGCVGCSTAAWRGPCCWPQASLLACAALL